MMSAVTSRVLQTKPLKWKEFKFIQDEGFKDFPVPAGDRLRASILANSFTEPFYVWNDPSDGSNYCLDGFHRIKTLYALIKEGHKVPEELPATLISCANKTEAARLVLQYSSVYAKVTEDGFLNFVETYDFDILQLSEVIDLPGLDAFKTETGNNADPFNDSGIPAKSQFGVIVFCADEQIQEGTYYALTEQGYNCKIVVT